MRYYATVGAIGKRAYSTVSHEQAIYNALRMIKRRAARYDLPVDPGEPHWTRGCLTWTFAQGVSVGGSVVETELSGPVHMGGEVWHIRADETMVEED